MSNLPTLSELKNNSLKLSKEQKAVNALMNQDPPSEWIKVNKYANGAKYVPIDIVEYLLRSLYPNSHRIELLDQGIAFNAVWVKIRLHYRDLVTGEWMFHDGIGASDVQVKSGSSPSELNNINKNAIAMAFPIAESEAIKDASHKLGRIFGSDINRKSEVEYENPETLVKFERGHPKWDKAVEAIAKNMVTIEQSKTKYNITELGEQQLKEDIEKWKLNNSK